MNQFFEVLIFVFIGIFLLWFGYTIFFRTVLPALGGGTRKPRKPQPLKPKGEGIPGAPQTCPVCSAKLDDGELISSSAFPSLNGGKDRFMHIRGCLYCLRGERERVCPVCGAILELSDILISRLYERPGRRSHVHVIGCTKCKGPRSRLV